MYLWPESNPCIGTLAGKVYTSMARFGFQASSIGFWALNLKHHVWIGLGADVERGFCVLGIRKVMMYAVSYTLQHYCRSS